MAITASKDGSPSERLANAYLRLSRSAASLNTASDALGTAIAASDEQLRGLNLGVPAWIIVAQESHDEAETYWQKWLGYDRVDGKWGIALRDEAGHWDNPGAIRYQTWLFNDAPRSFRLEALPKLPDLFEELVKQVDETTAKIEAATSEAQQLADTLKQIAPQTQPKKQGAR
jgi:hypothetical protein